PRISVPLPSRNVTGPVRVIVIGSVVITVRLRTVPHLLHKRRSILRKYCTVVAPYHEGICAALAGGCDAGASRNCLHGGRRDDRDHRFAPPHQPRAAVAPVPPGHVGAARCRPPPSRGHAPSEPARGASGGHRS